MSLGCAYLGGLSCISEIILYGIEITYNYIHQCGSVRDFFAIKLQQLDYLNRCFVLSTSAHSFNNLFFGILCVWYFYVQCTWLVVPVSSPSQTLGMCEGSPHCSSPEPSCRRCRSVSSLCTWSLPGWIWARSTTACCWTGRKTNFNYGSTCYIVLLQWGQGGVLTLQISCKWETSSLKLIRKQPEDDYIIFQY